MPEVDIGDEMVERAARCLEDNGYEDTGGMDRDVVRAALRAALRAAFRDVPVINYGIGLCLQFFDLVICIRDDGLQSRAGVYQHGGEPHTFDALDHHLNLTWSEKPRRHVARVDVSKIRRAEDEHDA